MAITNLYCEFKSLFQHVMNSISIEDYLQILAELDKINEFDYEELLLTPGKFMKEKHT